ncbi:unnamed protein product [Durusdinium trenchii]|uniref:Uncharacterized protein n=1 Tax=Durusdinium trenchii TaxID=1381693 RepID=A0ABP0LVA2_9DINO
MPFGLATGRTDPHRARMRPSSPDSPDRYRAQGHSDYPPLNGLLLPVLLDPLLVWHVHHKRSRWYIQNEVVSGAYGSGNKFGIERIRRFKAGRAWGTRRFKGDDEGHSNADRPSGYRRSETILERSWLMERSGVFSPFAEDLKMNFGLRVAFDYGNCTGPTCRYDWENLAWVVLYYARAPLGFDWELSDAGENYGYNVGCNNLGSFPFPKYETNYTGGIWYSLPGPCPSMPFYQQNGACERLQPGGKCDGTPTGSGDCGWTADPQGEEIWLGELYGETHQSMQQFWNNSHGLKNTRVSHPWTN